MESVGSRERGQRCALPKQGRGVSKMDQRATVEIRVDCRRYMIYIIIVQIVMTVRGNNDMALAWFVWRLMSSLLCFNFQ